MKKALMFVFGCFVSLAAMCQTATVTVTNTEKVQRQEVVEVDLQQICKALNCKSDARFVVKNALNQEVSYQISYDCCCSASSGYRSADRMPDAR